MQNLTPEAFSNAFKNTSNAVILDVRTLEEFESGHLPGALLVDVNKPDFHEQVENLSPSDAYFVYCRSGVRSVKAAMIMEDLGFEHVNNLIGGITAWNGEVE